MEEQPPWIDFQKQEEGPWNDFKSTTVEEPSALSTLKENEPSAIVQGAKKALKFAVTPFYKVKPEQVLGFGSSPVMGRLVERGLENISEGEGMAAKMAGAILGVTEAAADTASSFTSPVGIATAGLAVPRIAAKIPQTAQRVIALGFGADMARHIPEQARLLGEATVTGDSRQAARAAANLAVNTGFATLALKHGATPKKNAPVEGENVLDKPLEPIVDLQKGVRTPEEVVTELQKTQPSSEKPVLEEPLKEIQVTEKVEPPGMSWLDVLDRAVAEPSTTQKGKLLATMVDRFKKGDRSAENFQNMASLMDSSYDPTVEPSNVSYKMERVFGPGEKIKSSTEALLKEAESKRDQIGKSIENTQAVLDRQTDPQIRETITRNIRTLEREFKTVSDQVDVAKAKVLEETVGTPLTPEELAAHAQRVKELPKPSGTVREAQPIPEPSKEIKTPPSPVVEVRETSLEPAKDAPTLSGNTLSEGGVQPLRARVFGRIVEEPFSGGKHSQTVQVNRTDLKEISEADSMDLVPEELRPSLDKIERFRGSFQPGSRERGASIGGSKLKFIFKDKASAEKFKQSMETAEAPAEVAGQEILGMGGARPSEFVPPKNDPTSNKNATVDAERAERGLDPVMEPLKRTFGEAWEEAMQKINRSPDYQDTLIEKLKKKPRALTDTENAVLLQRRADLRNEYEKAVQDGIRAFEEGRPLDVADADVRVKIWSDKLSELEAVSKKVGTESGRSLSARRMMMNTDFSLAALELRKREANGFRPLTQSERAELVSLRDKISKLEDQINSETSGGKKPKPSTVDKIGEVEKIKTDFDKSIAGDKFKNLPLFKKIFPAIGEASNILRTLMTSGELSAVLRQGKFIMASHPVRGSKSIGPMLEALKSEKARFRIDYEITQRPNYPAYQRSGLFLSEHGAKLSAMEEAYMSRLAERIPGLGQIAKASERAYSTFLNKLRADSYDAMAATLSRKKELSPIEEEAIANYVNVVTGRGSLGGGKIERAAAALNSVFFSPRYVASRFQILFGQPFYKGTARTRMLIAKEYARFAAGMATVYTLGLMALPDAEVELDPRSSDFGKLRIGNTRIDPLAGLSQLGVFVSRLASGKIKTVDGELKPIRGEGVKYGGTDTLDVAVRFGRSKLSPGVSFIVDTAVQKDIVGNDVTLKSVAQKNLIPITYQSTLDLMEDQGIERGIALQILAILGEGVQTYEQK